LAFKLFIGRKSGNNGWLGRGQDWHDESVEENLALCEYEEYRHIFERYFSRDSIVLEAGCGLGRWVLYFKKRGYKVIGCDISRQALKDVKSYDPSISVVAADILDLPFRSGSYDAVISLGVIEHFEDGPGKAIEEMGRVLKPRGTLLVAVPYNSLFRRALVNRFRSLKSLVLKALGYEMVFTEYRYSRAELIGFLKGLGFEVLSCYPEMLVRPKHIGAYVDYIHLTGVKPKSRWEVPEPIKTIANLTRSISPWLISGTMLCVARKKT